MTPNTNLHHFDRARSRVLIALLGRRSPAKLVKQAKSHTILRIPSLPSPLWGRKCRLPGFGIGPWTLSHGRLRWSFPFVRIGRLREWYFPALAEVWRKGDRAYIRFWPAFKLRRWLFTRCEGCGKRFKYGHSPVHTLAHIHAPKTRSIMLGETGMYHFGCPHDPAADAESIRGWERMWGHDPYLRVTVLNEPLEVARELAALHGVAREAEMAYRKRLHDIYREAGRTPYSRGVPVAAEAEALLGDES